MRGERNVETMVIETPPHALWGASQQAVCAEIFGRAHSSFRPAHLQGQRHHEHLLLAVIEEGLKQ